MREYTKPILIIAVVIAIGVVVINDIGAVVFAQLRADELAEKIGAEAIRIYQQTNSERAAGLAAVEAGNREGIEVYGFQVKENKLSVWTRIPLRKTIILWRFPDLTKRLKAEGFFTDTTR